MSPICRPAAALRWDAGYGMSALSGCEGHAQCSGSEYRRDADAPHLLEYRRDADAPYLLRGGASSQVTEQVGDLGRGDRETGVGGAVIHAD